FATHGVLGTYVLTMTDVDDFRADTGTLGKLTLFQPGGSELDYPGDVDWLRIRLEPGQAYTIWVDGASTGSGTLEDPVVQLYSRHGELIASANDGGWGSNAALQVITTSESITGGVNYYVAVSSGGNSTGTYRVLVSQRDDYQDTVETAGLLTSSTPVTG